MADTEKKDLATSEDGSAEPAAEEKSDADKNAEDLSAPPSSDFFAAREAQATGETYRLAPEEIKQRNKRSLAIALGIVLFMVLVFAITVLRIGAASGG